MQDSNKARRRLAKIVERNCFVSTIVDLEGFDYKETVRDTLEEELGISFELRMEGRHYVRSLEMFFIKLSIPEFLDSITVVVRFLDQHLPSRSATFIAEAARVLREENLAYEIDSLGGIHPLIDAVFSATRQSAVLALNGERYNATAELIDLVERNLLQEPSNYVGAIRAVFGANENLFKLMYNVPRLDARTAGGKLLADQQSIYAGHPNSQKVSAKMLEAFKEWIDAAHFYRHEQGETEPNQPVEEIAIAMISQGLSHVRWLAQLDKKLLQRRAGTPA